MVLLASFGTISVPKGNDPDERKDGRKGNRRETRRTRNHGRQQGGACTEGINEGYKGRMSGRLAWADMALLLLACMAGWPGLWPDLAYLVIVEILQRQIKRTPRMRVFRAWHVVHFGCFTVCQVFRASNLIEVEVGLLLYVVSRQHNGMNCPSLIAQRRFKVSSEALKVLVTHTMSNILYIHT